VLTFFLCLGRAGNTFRLAFFASLLAFARSLFALFVKALAFLRLPFMFFAVAFAFLARVFTFFLALRAFLFALAGVSFGSGFTAVVGAARRRDESGSALTGR